MEGATRAPIIDAITIRYEKYGTLYHISSVEVLSGEQRARLAVSAAITAESKEALDHEFDLLRQLGHQSKLSYLPQAYCKHAVHLQKGEASETLLMTLSEWFENYHEWHFSRDEEGRERIVIWDMKGGYRLASGQEAYEIIRQASTILISYYNTETYHRIFPWHHGAGDFVVKAVEGVVDVKLVTARGYEPIAFPEQDRKVCPARALILFFLETTVKMRLDKWEGMGESTWADASVVGAATDGFFQALRMKESEHDAHASNVDNIMKQLKSFTEDELKKLLHSHMNQVASRHSSDYAVISSHVDDHARDVLHAVQSLPG
jgi:hypothetical protein